MCAPAMSRPLVYTNRWAFVRPVAGPIITPPRTAVRMRCCIAWTCSHDATGRAAQPAGVMVGVAGGSWLAADGWASGWLAGFAPAPWCAAFLLRCRGGAGNLMEPAGWYPARAAFSSVRVNRCDLVDG